MFWCENNEFCVFLVSKSLELVSFWCHSKMVLVSTKWQIWHMRRCCWTGSTTQTPTCPASEEPRGSSWGKSGMLVLASISLSTPGRTSMLTPLHQLMKLPRLECLREHRQSSYCYWNYSKCYNVCVFFSEGWEAYFCHVGVGPSVLILRTLPWQIRNSLMGKYSVELFSDELRLNWKQIFR